jgi:hypothetical protein
MISRSHVERAPLYAATALEGYSNSNGVEYSNSAAIGRMLDYIAGADDPELFDRFKRSLDGIESKVRGDSLYDAEGTFYQDEPNLEYTGTRDRLTSYQDEGFDGRDQPYEQAYDNHVYEIYVLDLEEGVEGDELNTPEDDVQDHKRQPDALETIAEQSDKNYAGDNDMRDLLGNPNESLTDYQLPADALDQSTQWAQPSIQVLKLQGEDPFVKQKGQTFDGFNHYLLMASLEEGNQGDERKVYLPDPAQQLESAVLLGKGSIVAQPLFDENGGYRGCGNNCYN